MNNKQTVEVEITATVRIVSSIQGRVLSRAEEFKTSATFPQWVTDNASVISAMCDTEVRLAFQKLFVTRLRNDFVLKSKIGGTKWSVDPMLVNYELLSLEKV